MTEVGTGCMGGMQRHFPSCWNGWSKAKTHSGLKLAREVKGSKTAFCKYVIRRRMDRPVVQWGKGSNEMGQGKGSGLFWMAILCLFYHSNNNLFIKHIKIGVSKCLHERDFIWFWSSSCQRL